MQLELEVRLPETARDGSPLIVLLHGRGSDRFDLLGLRPALPADAVIVTPQAPFPAAQWGYGPGWAWYRYLGDDRPEPESFDRSHELLGQLLESLPDRLSLDPGPLVLGGFSQGGTMALSHALQHPGRVPHVVNFSGFLAVHPAVRTTPETVSGTRFFWGHGVDDPAIPLEMAERGRRSLRSAGADLEARDYPIGHWIEATELGDLAAWLERGLAAGGIAGGKRATRESS